MTTAVACGDDDGGPAAEADADVTEDPDAAPEPTHTGQILFMEAAYNGFDMLGQGVFMQMLLQENAAAVRPSYEQMPGAPFACKAFEFTPEELAAPGVDTGSFQFSVDQGGPVIPPCTFQDGEGYRCIGATGTGGNIAQVDPDVGTVSLNNPAVTFTEDEIGRMLNITGSAIGPNNGMFPIVAVPNENTVVFRNPNGMDETGTAASYRTLAGFGPAGQMDPLANDATLTAELTAIEGGALQDFSTTVDIGDSFTLDTASQALISDIPLDGSAFTLACDGEGGDCGTAMATGVIIQTTDADVTGVPGFVLPPPEEKAVRLFCLFLTGSATVPAEASAFLADSGATRVRTLFARGNPANIFQADGTLSVVAGHALIGFTTPAAP